MLWASWCTSSKTSGGPRDPLGGLLVIFDVPVHISLLSPMCGLIQDLLLLPLEYSPMRLCPLIGLFPVFSGHVLVPLERGDDLLPAPLNLTFTSVIPSQSNPTHGSEKSCATAQDPRPSCKSLCIVLFINTLFRDPLSRFTFQIF